ncbi:MAG: hypothetical protein AB7O50_01390 [Pseudolabrys sp.]
MWTHFDFAIVFAGLGFIGLWAFAAADVARNLSPGLQLVGLVTAIVAVVRIAMLLRARRAKSVAAEQPPAQSLAVKIRRNGLIRRPPKRRKPVEPRSEFGLRKPGPWPRQ